MTANPCYGPPEKKNWIDELAKRETLAVVYPASNVESASKLPAELTAANCVGAALLAMMGDLSLCKTRHFVGQRAGGFVVMRPALDVRRPLP